MATGTSRTASRASAADQTSALAEDVAEAGRSGAGALDRVLFAPVTMAREVVDDVASAARRPETVMYWGGLAALTVIGAIELPVAAAIGVGVAVAGGMRRSQGGA
jgi:hypothetical protein